MKNITTHEIATFNDKLAVITTKFNNQLWIKLAKYNGATIDGYPDGLLVVAYIEINANGYHDEGQTGEDMKGVEIATVFQAMDYYRDQIKKFVRM
jgi:hypothetical protein